MYRIHKSVIGKEFCCGCGVCAGVCPTHALSMQWNEAGEYHPYIVNECTECGMCLHLCPFENTNPNEDEIGTKLFSQITNIQHKSETGYYLSSYVGAVTSDTKRLQSASGGLATWFLKELLMKNIADAVICVRKSIVPEKLYEFFIAETEDDIDTSSGSAYYPTEMSGVVREILETPKRYAVIGVPCFVKALRLAQSKNKKLRDRIVCIAGLTCGKMKSTKFTEAVAKLSGLDEEISSVHFRTKSMDRPANQFAFAYTGVNGSETSIIWNDGIGQIWSAKQYNIPVCNFCDDIFAECADVTFMDAWLPEYTKDSRGTSLVIVRSEQANDVFKSGNDISIEPISIEKVMASQRGVIQNKRELLKIRLSKAGNVEQVPNKRVTPAHFNGTFIQLKLIVKRYFRFGLALVSRIIYQK